MANTDQKTVIKEIKSHIKEINKRTGAKLSYNDIYNKMDVILKMTDEDEKDSALADLYIELSKAISAKMLSKRVEIKSNELIEDKNINHPARDYSINDASLESRGLVEEIYKLLNPEFDGDYRLSDKQLTAIRDYELEEIKKFSSYREIPKYLEKWNRKNFDNDLERFNTNFPEVKGTLRKYKYKGDINNPKDVMAAEYYYKAYLAKKELDSHGRIWRFFFYKTVDAYNKYIDDVERALLDAGIDVSFDRPFEENESILNLLNNRPASSLNGEVEEIGKIYDIYKPNTKESYAKQFNIPIQPSNTNNKIENELDKDNVKINVNNAKSEEVKKVDVKKLETKIEAKIEPKIENKPDPKPVDKRTEVNKEENKKDEIKKQIENKSNEKKTDVKKEESKSAVNPESVNKSESSNIAIEKEKENLVNYNVDSQEYVDQILNIQAMLEAQLKKEMEGLGDNSSTEISPPVTETNKKDVKIVKK